MSETGNAKPDNGRQHATGNAKPDAVLYDTVADELRRCADLLAEHP